MPMIFTVLAIVAGTAAGLLTGGRHRHVTSHPMRAWWLLVVGFAVQTGVARFGLGAVSTVVLVVGYGSLLAFAAANRTLVGIGIVAVGLAANALVIGINGGMPVRPAAVVAAHITGQQGLAHVDYGRLHHRERPGDHLSWLGDTVPVSPLHEVLSFGDLILAVGVADVIAHLLHPRRPRLGGRIAAVLP
jgi:hypothetical protein